MRKDISREIRRIRAYSAAEFFKHGSFRLLNCLYAPKELEYLLKKEEKKTEEFISKDIALNWFATPKIRRHAINILGNETLCPARRDIERLGGGPEKWPVSLKPILYREDENAALGICKNEQEKSSS